MFRDGEGCSPRRYELVSDDESVSVSESDLSSFITASVARCVSNPSDGGAKIGAWDSMTGGDEGGNGDGKIAAATEDGDGEEGVDGGKDSPWYACDITVFVRLFTGEGSIINSERKDDEETDRGGDGDAGSDDNGELVSGSLSGGGGVSGEEVGGVTFSGGDGFVRRSVSTLSASCVS